MLADVKRGFIVTLGTYRDPTVLRFDPGVVEVPEAAATHWYFQANVRSGNVTVLEQIDAAAGRRAEERGHG